MSGLIKKFMVVAVLFSWMAVAQAATQWSDNFNGGAQQTWAVVDGGNSSIYAVQNDQYELHTESSDGSSKSLASYVNASAADCILQTRVKRMATGDNFLTYLLARSTIATMSGYVCGSSSDGTHLWFGKLTGGVYSSLSAIGPTSYDPTDFQLRFALFGSTLAAKVWTTGGAEPANWQIVTTDAGYTSGVSGVLLATYPTLDWDTVQAAFDEVSLTELSQSTVWVDTNWTGTAANTEVAPGKIYGYNAFATIQNAINTVVADGTVNVAAGTYAEQLVINQAVTLLGPNATINPNTGVRFGEALLVPPSILNVASTPREWNNDAVIKIAADGVVVKGFTVSGDNPLLNGYEYADMNVEAGLGVSSAGSNIVFQNNIVEKFTYIGFQAEGSYSELSWTKYQGLVVEDNLFRNIHDLNQLGYGFAIVVKGTAGSITGNTVVNCRTGIQIQPYRVIGDVTPVLSDNSFSCWRQGIYYNVAEAGAGAWTISGNHVTACLPPAVPTGLVVWEGICANTMYATANGGLISGNLVDGTVAMTDASHAGWGGFDHAVWGLRYAGASTSTSTNVVFAGNTVDNVSFGFVHEAAADIVLAGNTLTASDAVIVVQRGRSSTGVAADAGGINNIDATGGNVLNGVDSATASLAQLLAIEDAIVHKVDNVTLGLVRVIVGDLYVTTTSGSIQTVIDAATSNDTINVAAGTYVEVGQILIDKNLTIVGENKVTTIIKPAQNISDAKAFMLVGAGVTMNLSNVTIDGDGKLVYEAIRTKGSGIIDNVIIKNIHYNQYSGRAIAYDYSVPGQNWTISNCTFQNIQRVDILVDGQMNQATITGNDFIAKGAGDYVNYGVEVGDGAHTDIGPGNAFSNFLGVASSDGSYSGGILVTSYFGPAPSAIVSNNTFSNNSHGVLIGYGEDDTSFVTITNNTFIDNSIQMSAVSSNVVDLNATFVNNTFDKCAVITDGTNILPGINFFNTIQAAIDVATAGDVIEVAGGIYNENITVAHTGLEIRGIGTLANPTILDGAGLTVNQLVYFVETDDVLNEMWIHGFTFKPTTPATGKIVLVDANMVQNNGTVKVTDNIFDCTSNPNAIGFYAHTSNPTGNIKFLSNTINGSGDNSILIERVEGPCEIGYNTINQAEGGGSAIYSMSYTDSNGAHNVTGKHWYHHNTITAAGTGGYGITIASAPYWLGATASGGIYSDVDVSNNEISNIAADGSGINLQVGGTSAGIPDAIVNYNIISSVASSSDNKAINLDGPVTGTSLIGNSLSGFGIGILASVQDIGGTLMYPSGVVANNNDLLSNLDFGLKNENPTASINATRNYWGAEDGPSGEGSGSGDSVSLNVSYSPWYEYDTMNHLVYADDLEILDTQTIGAGEGVTVPGTLTIGTVDEPVVMTVNGGTLNVGTLDLVEGSVLIVIDGELVLGETDGEQTIAGTFTIYNSFGSIYFYGNTTFSEGTLALISDIHVEADATLTVSGTLTLDGCVVDSQTPGTPFNIVVTDTGILNMIRTDLTDADITLNGDAAELRDNLLTDVTIDVAVGASGNRILHNVFLDNVVLNDEGDDTVTTFDGWGNVASLSATTNNLVVGLVMTNLPSTRTLDAGGNLFIQPGDTVRINLDVGSLNRKISGVEAMLGFSTNFFNTGSSTLGPVDPWLYELHSLFSSDGVYGKIDTGIGLDITFPDSVGTTDNGSVAAIDMDSKVDAADGVTKFYFRTRQTGDNAQATTRISGFDGTDDYELLPFTLNTGEITVDGTAPEIDNFTATQDQNGTDVDVFGTAFTHQGTVTFTVDAFDSTAGIDTNDVVCTVSNVSTHATMLALQTGTESVTNGEQTNTCYTFEVDVNESSLTGIYSVSVDATDRSGNVSDILTGTFEFVRRVTVTVQLEGAVTGPFTRDVTFVATDASEAVLDSWTQSVEFTDGSGMTIIDEVSVDMAHLSAKTGFSLRRRIDTTLDVDGDGQGAVSFTGTGVGGNQLLGGDLNEDNVVNMTDFNRLRYYWYTDNTEADIDGDGATAVGDLNILKANWYVTGDLQ